MTRRIPVIIALLIGLIIGYLAGCRSHVQSRTITHDPAPGQHWHERGGTERIVRCVTREGDESRVWWYRSGARGADRHCTVKTWRNWARTKGVVPE